MEFCVCWVGRTVSKAFNDALAEAGSRKPVWLILLMAKPEALDTQHELAQAVGIKGPSLTCHLDAMEARISSPGPARSRIGAPSG
jgi:MarR family transcriptional regulator, transcriptional regulator for hemolysin